MLGAARWVAWDELWFALGTRTWGSQLDFCIAFLLSGKTTDTWIFPWGSACKSPCSCPWAERKEAGIPDSCSWSKELCCLILCSSCLPPLPSFGPALAPLYSQSKFFPAQLSLRTLPKFPTWLCSCKVSYPTTNPMFLYLVLTLKKTAAKYTCMHTLVHNHMLARMHNHIRDKTSYWEVGMWVIQDLVQNDDCK